jgi:predicted HAD superfamily Cof-like phosphohydrolase
MKIELDGFTDFQVIGLMHNYFGLPVRDDLSAPHHISDDLANFRLHFIMEEAKELQKAYETKDLVEIADALVDIVVVALGTAHMHNLPFDHLFEEVFRSNMTKVRVNNASESKRGTAFDLKKAEGYKSPEIEKILKAYGYLPE